VKEVAPHIKIENCRSCGGSNLSLILSLGDSPLADRLLTKEDLSKPELVAPLDLVFCLDCALVQITVSVSPDVLFCNDYPYYSSVSPSLLKHFRDSALSLIDKRSLSTDSLVIEAASNDGYMLKNFVGHGIDVLGIDPAEGPANEARAAGVETRIDFFGTTLARELKQQGKTADVFLANNVLAHVPDLNGFVEGIQELLKPSGVAVLEMPYVLDLVEKLEFDTIYHQHLCYFSVTTLRTLFARHKLHLNDIERTAIHGGSLRLFVEHNHAPTKRLSDLIDLEQSLGLDRVQYYETFGRRVEGLRRRLVELIAEQRREGKRIVGYGAAAKATTLMTYCGIGEDELDYVVDMNAHKHGKFMGGNHLEIFSTERLLDDVPDTLLILAWNFADEIMQQQNRFSEAGGSFLVPIPKPELIPQVK